MWYKYAMKRFPLLIAFFLIFNVYIFSKSESIEKLKKRVEDIGKLKFKTDIHVKYFNKPQMINYVEKMFNEQYPDELAKKENLFVYLMGFSDKEVELKKQRKSIFLNNVIGLYNEKTKELYVLDAYRNIDKVNSLIIVHELRHSIQDQYFNLLKILGDYSDFDDRKLAALSAVEGDATFLMMKYAQKYTPFPLNPDSYESSFIKEPLISFLPISNLSAIPYVPDIVKSQMIMPYFRGLKFINYIFKKKKWEKVNEVLNSPPESTEQILHPKKYLKGEIPIKVKIDYEPDVYKLYHYGVIGEYYLNILLKEDNKYVDYALGWGGDRFKVYKNLLHYFLLWESVWDKEKFCTSFYIYFKKFIEKKFNVNFKNGCIKGKLFIAGNSNSGYFFIRRYRNKIFYVRSNDRDQINRFIDGGFYD